MSTGAVKILLVEDSLSDAELLGFALKRTRFAPFSIRHVESWAEAAQCLRQEPFDVLLLDLSLPDGDGPETFLRARAEARGIPIVVLTGNEDEEIGLEAVRHGIEDYLIKGVADGAQIARAIRYAIERARAEAALSNYRELFRTVIEGTSDAVYAKDLRGRYLLANAAAARLCGKNREEMIGKDDPALFRPKEAKVLKESDHAILEQGKTLTFEETITLGTGERKTFLATKGPLLDGLGKLIGVFGISHDVTQMKEAERHREGVAALLKLFALGSSRKEYLATVVKLLGDWCGCQCVGVRLRDQDGRLPYVAQVGFSKEFLRQERGVSLVKGDCACVRVLAGRPRPEDGAWSSLGGSLVCNDASRYAAQFGANPKECGQVACLKAGYESLAHAPLRYRNQILGTLHFADTRPGKFPPETIAFVEAAAVVIAEALHRLKVEESLVESEARFRSMFERHASVMLLIDPETGAIVDANPAGAAFYGYSQNQLRHMKIGDLHQRPVEAVAASPAGALSEERSFWVELHRLANGESRMIEAHSSPMQVQGRRLLFSIIHDITGRMQLQKEVLEISEKERQRIGQDLHDSLGGRLTGTALMSKALAQRLAALGLPEAALALEIVNCTNESIRETRSIAHGLCPLALSGSGLVGALAEFAAEAQRSSGVCCHFHADEGFQINERFVALHLFRLVLEAVNNALRHAQPRNITILLTSSPSQVMLEVRDDGKGLPANLPADRGLGLRTMRYRAESIGARLTINRGETGGTVVSCLLALAQIETGDHWQL